ncbi:MAG: MATE family efflux transporter [Clostridiales bacterium]|nr:MATE family efflux transporter [Clostridiales bacterium]
MSEDKTIIRDFTKGSIPRLLLFFMLPFMASNVLQVLYSAVDMIIVGQCVGTAGLSAVSLCSEVLNFCTMLCTGLCTGGQVLIAQMLGAGKKKELNRIIGTLTIFVFSLAVIIAVLLFFLRPQFCTLINMPAEAHDMAMSYLGICAIGLVFSFGYNMVSAVLRGLGDAKRPFIFITLASVINIVLDILFTGILGFGVVGAAMATMIGQAVSFLFSLFYIYRHRDMLGFEFDFKDWGLDTRYLKMIASQGLPLAISSGMIYVSMFFVNSLINSVGVVASATFGVGVKIDDICNKVSIGIRYAAAPMVAQNYAARNVRRTKQITYWAFIYGIIFHLVFMAIYLAFGKYFFRLFTTDADVLALAPVFIHSIIWTFLPLAFMRGTNAFVQGIGNARLSMVFSLMDGVICRIGLSLIFGKVMGMGFAGYVLGYGLAPCGAAIPGIIYFFSGVWMKRESLVEKLDKDSAKSTGANDQY